MAELRHEYDINVGHDVTTAPGETIITETPVQHEARLAEERAAMERDHEERQQQREARKEAREARDRVNVISHSSLFYWWPVWAFGYVMAALTWFTGQSVSIGNLPEEMIHRSNGPGLLYTLIIFFVILITNISLRGWLSGMVILGAMFVAVLLAWLRLWDEILQIIPHVNVHMNFGFYMLLSTLVLIIWLLTTFVFDRLTYWRVEAGQVTKEHLIGTAEESYDTGGLILEEHHDDLFRHWLLGLGSGDLRMKVANQMHDLPNVLFAGAKVKKIQRLIKRKPD